MYSVQHYHEKKWKVKQSQIIIREKDLKLEEENYKLSFLVYNIHWFQHIYVRISMITKFHWYNVL